MTITSAEVLGTLHQGWITPQEQMERLALSQFEKDLGIDHEPLPSSFSSLPVYDVFKSAIHSILNRSRVTLAGSEEPPSLFNLCVEQLIPSRPLPSNLTNWYTALERIDALHDTIPPLPEDIRNILEGTCPIYGDPLTVSETHSLYLIPPGTLNELEQRVNAYGREFFLEETPLKFGLFFAREEHANVPNNQPQWVLITNDVLPGSRMQSYVKQVQIVGALSRRRSVDYQVPTLREAIGAIFLHKVATNESLYEGGNKQNGYLPTHTRVKESTLNGRLIVGGVTVYGLNVGSMGGDGIGYLGIAAVRKLSNQSVSI